MESLIIYCHPYPKSFNYAVLEAVKDNLKDHHKNFQVIDLYAEHFNPIYDREELRLYHSGKTHDRLVTKYLKLLQNSSEVIFITPFWWNGIPGMLKGFIDKVMKEGKGLSHTITKLGVHGELMNIKHTYILTTSTSPTWYIRFCLGNGIKRIFLNKTLKQLGMQDRHWLNFGRITNSSSKRRSQYLKEIQQIQF